MKTKDNDEKKSNDVFAKDKAIQMSMARQAEDEVVHDTNNLIVLGTEVQSGETEFKGKQLAKKQKEIIYDTMNTVDLFKQNSEEHTIAENPIDCADINQLDQLVRQQATDSPSLKSNQQTFLIQSYESNLMNKNVPNNGSKTTSEQTAIVPDYNNNTDGTREISRDTNELK